MSHFFLRLYFDFASFSLLVWNDRPALLNFITGDFETKKQRKYKERKQPFRQIYGEGCGRAILWIVPRNSYVLWYTYYSRTPHTFNGFHTQQTTTNFGVDQKFLTPSPMMQCERIPSEVKKK